MKKFLTFILVLAMVMSVSSFAMAAEVTVTTEQGLKDAVIVDGNNITLGANIALSGTLTIPTGVNVTLNLGGYTLSYTTDVAGSTALIKNDGTLTINGPGTISNIATKPDSDWNPEGFPTYANNTITNCGKLTVDGGAKIENGTTGKGAYYAIDNNSTSRDAILVIEDGELVCHNNVAIRQFANSSTNANSVTIKDGTVTGSRAVWMHLPGSSSSSEKKASLSVEGGTLTATKASEGLAIYTYSYGDSYNNTEVSISGGKLNGAVGLMGGAKDGTPKVSISGGSMTGVEDYSGNLEEIISGGSFTEDPSALLAADYVVSEDANGNYVTAKATEVNAPADGEDASVTTSNSDEIVKIAKEQVNALADGKSLVVKTANGMEFTFSKELLSGLLGNDGSYVAIKIKKIGQTELNDAQQKAIESTDAKLVFTAEIYVNGEYVGDKLNGKKVQVYIPVGAVDLGTTQASPNLDGYSLVYISDDGKLEIIANAEAGAYEIKAELPHFSEYAVIKTEDANKIIASQNTPTTKPSSGSGISVKYNGGNSFSTSNPSVPTGVEIDGVPVTFNGTGSNFTVGCISSDAKWVTVRWNSTSVTTNFTPDGLVECTTVSIPKTGGMSIWAAIAQFLGF